MRHVERLFHYARQCLRWIQSQWDAAHRILAKIDPNDDPQAEPLGILPVLALVIAVTFSVWMFLRWRVQPMQDFGHHLAMSAVFSDWGRKGSIYTDLYEPVSFLNANSLMYAIAGVLGRIFGVVGMVRACMVFYVAGVPLFNLYALRVFGRSPWGAVLSVPLVYNMIFVAGFANLLFAAPFMVLLLPRFYRALAAPSITRTIFASALFVAVFLAHAHAYLWMGALCATMTLVALAFTLRTPKRAATIVVVALASVLPSLVLFWRWYERTFGEERAKGGVLGVTSGMSDSFGAIYTPLQSEFSNIADYCFKYFSPPSTADYEGLLRLFVLTALAITISRIHKYARPPVLEVAFVLTGVSYFFLPEHLTNHQVLATRQISIALWFISALVGPVPWRVSRLGHVLVVCGILYVTRFFMTSWYGNLVAFEATEANGLEWVLAAAPPRLRLQYIKLRPDSAYFSWHQFWHVEKYYMGDKLGSTPETPGILSTGAIHFRAGVDIHRIVYSRSDWSSDKEIWDNFELVLIHKWEPTPAELAAANLRGVRVRKAGDWELWRTKGAWQTE